jgi:DNA-binding beta-propeller fold protein YncE
VRTLVTWAVAATATASFGQSGFYQIGTAAGSDWVGDGGVAISAILLQAEGLAADASGNVYVADASGHRVRRISPGGVIPGFSGDGGPAVAAQFNAPYGLALDRNGNLYIADLGNARVRKIAPDGTITTVAGVGTSAPGGVNDGGPALSMSLNAPRNVAADSSGNLYISDFSAHRVYRLSPGAR